MSSMWNGSGDMGDPLLAWRHTVAILSLKQMDKRDNQFKITVNDELQYKIPHPSHPQKTKKQKKQQHRMGWKHITEVLCQNNFQREK